MAIHKYFSLYRRLKVPSFISFLSFDLFYASSQLILIQSWVMPIFLPVH